VASGVKPILLTTPRTPRPARRRFAHFPLVAACAARADASRAAIEWPASVSSYSPVRGRLTIALLQLPYRLTQVRIGVPSHVISQDRKLHDAELRHCQYDRDLQLGERRETVLAPAGAEPCFEHVCPSDTRSVIGTCGSCPDRYKSAKSWCSVARRASGPVSRPVGVEVLRQFLQRRLGILQGDRRGCQPSPEALEQEKGRNSPSWETVVKLAAALGVECTAFQDGNTAAAPERRRTRARK
jgi:hypothetical protein